jgi:hypothetical protein
MGRRTLGLGGTIARLIVGRARCAYRIAASLFLACRGSEQLFLFGVRGLARLDRFIGSDERLFDFLKPVAAGKTARGHGLGIGKRGKAVPTPKIAFARYETLTGREFLLQARAVGAVDNTDLRQAAGERARRLDMRQQRFNAGRKRGIAFPASRCA